MNKTFSEVDFAGAIVALFLVEILLKKELI
jgi:hypothetical protein